MDDVVLTEVLQAHHNTGYQELYVILLITCIFFTERFLVEQPVPEIPARQIIHHQIQLLLVLERALHIDNKRVVERQQDLFLV